MANINEFEEIRGICTEYLKSFKIEDFDIVFATRINGHWKVIVRYSKPSDPDVTSLLLINWDTKKVDTFRERILSF